MEPCDYVVLRFDGDYAVLQRTDIETTDTFFIARAFLPPEADEGSKLHFEAFEYVLTE
ncbi:MAG: chorismate--pyruvate lyase [Clostridia bacterium]|nr:chorismate--pyruvate lyase [Clostridia bacterium]